MFDDGDVCYWEFKVDLDHFKATHPSANISDLFLNLVILNAYKVDTYQLQGTSRNNATNDTSNAIENKTYSYPLSEGQSVFLIAVPTASKSSLNFTFNLTDDYYPLQGMTMQLQAEITPDISRKGFWWFLGIATALGLFSILIIFFVICCKNFDPENDFERRRRKLAKE